MYDMIYGGQVALNVVHVSQPIIREVVSGCVSRHGTVEVHVRGSSEIFWRCIHDFDILRDIEMKQMPNLWDGFVDFADLCYTVHVLKKT